MFETGSKEAANRSAASAGAPCRLPRVRLARKFKKRKSAPTRRLFKGGPSRPGVRRSCDVESTAPDERAGNQLQSQERIISEEKKRKDEGFESCCRSGLWRTTEPQETSRAGNPPLASAAASPERRKRFTSTQADLPGSLKETFMLLTNLCWNLLKISNHSF